MGFISSHIHEFAFPNPLCVVFFFCSSSIPLYLYFQKRCGTIRWSRIFKIAFGRCSMSHEREFWATPKGGSLKFCLILVFSVNICCCCFIFYLQFLLWYCGIPFLPLGTIQTDKWFIWWKWAMQRSEQCSTTRINVSSKNYTILFYDEKFYGTYRFYAKQRAMWCWLNWNKRMWHTEKKNMYTMELCTL